MTDHHPFDPTPPDVRALGDAVAAWVAEHFSALADLPIVPDTTPTATFALFDEPVPEDGTPWPALLERFRHERGGQLLSPPQPALLRGRLPVQQLNASGVG